MCIEGIDHICCSNQGEILIKKMEIDVEIGRKGIKKCLGVELEGLECKD